MIKKMKEKILKYINDFTCEQKGIGSIELVLILLDNPFTSSTYILSY